MKSVKTIITRGMSGARWQLANQMRNSEHARGVAPTRSRELLRLAGDDLQRALNEGLFTGSTYYKVASNRAQIARETNEVVSEALDQQLLQWTRMAIERGFSRQDLERDVFLSSWAKRLPPDIGLVPSPRPPIFDGILDPVDFAESHPKPQG